MAKYAIGDIQGCFTPFKSLLDEVGFSPSRDQLWVAGDLINRGPENLATLRYLKSLNDSAKIVLGNHDLHFLAVAAGTCKQKKKDTFDDILNASDAPSLTHWLQQQPLLQYEPERNYVMVHAGIPPQWSLQYAQARADEVARALAGNPESFFKDMYGNQPEMWHENLTGTARLRAITNYFTRMRFCKADGTIELTTKTAASDAPKDYAPWFNHPNHKCSSTTILFGHWAALMGETQNDHAIALDTGCVWGNHLTLLDMNSQERITYSCHDCAF